MAITYLNQDSTYLTVAGALTVNTDIPLDSRSVADRLEDIYNTSNWFWNGTKIWYKGMIVSVIEPGNEGIYQLIGNDPSIPGNWRKESSSTALKKTGIACTEDELSELLPSPVNGDSWLDTTSTPAVLKMYVDNGEVTPSWQPYNPSNLAPGDKFIDANHKSSYEYNGNDWIDLTNDEIRWNIYNL